MRGLTRKPSDKPNVQLPALVIHQGTLILEDRANPTKPITLEINDLGMTTINDPLSSVMIRGAANSDLLGKLQIQGVLDRRTNETFLTFRALQLPLTPALVTRLPVQCPPNLFDGLQLDAQAKIEGRISFHPQLPQSFYYDIRCEVTDGKLSHPLIPLPLENLGLKLNCVNGELHLESLTARSGMTHIKARGDARLPCIDQDFSAEVDLKHVMLGTVLCERLPGKLKNLHEILQPEGPTTIHLACARRAGKWISFGPDQPSCVTLTPENISFAFKAFPYRLERTTGPIDYNLENQHLKFRLMAECFRWPSRTPEGRLEGGRSQCRSGPRYHHQRRTNRR